MAKAKKVLKKKAPAKKAASKKPLPKRSGTKKKIAKKPVAKKSVAKKPVGKKVPAKKQLTKKFVAKKVAVKKTAVNKPAIKKVVAPKAVAPKVSVPKIVAPKGPYGIPEQMRDAALKVLDERQADDIVTVNLAGRSAMADYMIIASGRASKQLGAISHYLREEFEKLGATSIRVEGVSEGNWVLLDAGDVIVHLFRPEVRRYYNLEQIWDRSGRNSEVSARDQEA